MSEKPITAEFNPLLALSKGEIEGVLAIIIRTEGPSYRSVGAAMVFGDDDNRYGSLSSGCIEADLAIHASNVRNNKLPQQIVYGRGSPYLDIQLPCGGGLEILLLPQPSEQELELLNSVERLRETVVLALDLKTGRITQSSLRDTTLNDTEFHFKLVPEMRFVVFGKGPEAYTFANLVHSLGNSGALVSPDLETLEKAKVENWEIRTIVHAHCPTDLGIDNRTAVTCFFHDHEWEAPILRDVLAFDSFYVGCQGSLRTSNNRLTELENLGVSAAKRSSVRGPIGLIQSARNSNTLAVSVLAEILSMS